MRKYDILLPLKILFKLIQQLNLFIQMDLLHQ